MSHPEQPPPGGPKHSAEHTVQIPPETPEETTQELPAVPPAPAAHQPEHLTVGLPLLDMLAPEQAQQPQPSPNQYGAPVMPPAGPPTGPHYAMPPQPSYGPQPQYGQPYGAPPPRRGPSQRNVLLIGAAAAVVLLLAILGVAALRSSPPPAQQGRPSSSAPQTSAIKVAGGYQFTQHAARSDTDCAANAYGKVAEFFQSSPCTRLDRALYGTTVDGKFVVVSVSMVQMPDEAKATELQKLADSNGTGNVSDLLRAGVRVPGGPEALSNAGYGSARNGAVVTITEADFADPGLRDEALLDRISDAALQLNK